jgi:hypothetical protein
MKITIPVTLREVNLDENRSVPEHTHWVAREEKGMIPNPLSLSVPEVTICAGCIWLKDLRIQIARALGLLTERLHDSYIHIDTQTGPSQLTLITTTDPLFRTLDTPTVA